MRENLEEQIKILGTNDNQSNHKRYLAFAAGLANNLAQHREFSNEFIRNLALTSDQDLVDLLKQNPEAFPYLLLLRIDLKENYTTLSDSMKDYVNELQNYIQNLEKYINDTSDLDDEWKDYFYSRYNQEFTTSNDLDNHKQWIEYFQETTIAKFIYDKFIALEKKLEGHEGLAAEDVNLLDSLYRNTLDTEAELMKNFNETAAIQLPSLGLDSKGLNQTISILQEVNTICVNQYINRTYSNELVEAGNIKDSLKRVNQEEIKDLIETKKVEEAKRLQEAKEAKIENAIKTLQEVKANLTTAQDPKDLIKQVNDIFENKIEDENFKKLKANLQEIANKQDLGALQKFLDDAIQFFKSLIGKDRFTKTKESIGKFTESLKKKQITPDKIKDNYSSISISTAT